MIDSSYYWNLRTWLSQFDTQCLDHLDPAVRQQVQEKIQTIQSLALNQIEGIRIYESRQPGL